MTRELLRSFGVRVETTTSVEEAIGHRRRDPDAPLAQDLAEVDRAVDSASGLTQQLLAFSRKQLIQPQVLDLNESVTRMRTMLSRLLGEDIALRQSTVPGLGLVRFDPTQAEQILVHFAVNARDAMPEGGTLTLETANVLLDEQYAREHPETEPGEYVMLAVSDTDMGMSAEVRSHLFEPFFTTKALGRGTGLGLPMVFGAVTQNQGRIDVYSEPGHGTTFKIYLPRVNPDATPRISPSRGTLPHGTETIVVVEDEDAIRALAVRVLTGLGYDVLAFRTGTAALDALASGTTHVDPLLTDVMMPEMKGRELAERLRATRPDLPVLFASGYTDDVARPQPAEPTATRSNQSRVVCSQVRRRSPSCCSRCTASVRSAISCSSPKRRLTRSAARA